MASSVFINEAGGNWILDILSNDIYQGLSKLGFSCRKGSLEDYKGEDIAFHMWWRRSVPYKDALINAVFVTHIDDKFKEQELVAMKNQFDLFICMSPEDSEFLVELGFSKEKVFGVDLPTRNNYIRPLSLAIFSNCYPETKVKHEDWLIDFCEKEPNSRILNFCFIGHDWEGVVNRLSKCGCSFEWHCVDRSLPYEYMFQQLKLSNYDYYLYMGMDGGAMGTYDAYAMGLDLCVSDDGYHKSIPGISYRFLTQEDFNNCLEQITEKQLEKINFFKSHSVDSYVKTVAYILKNKCYPDVESNELNLNYSVKEKRRNNYFKMTLKRLKQPLVSFITKLKNESKANKTKTTNNNA